jgi:carbon-monoxide dehydrogenase small subunit
MTRIALTVNGRQVIREVTPRTNLADFLREELLLTGTHIGCEHGICGACTVVVDGEIARSCITYAVTCDGAEVRTIENFDSDALMTKLRKAFSQEHALQCGYCTPGMLIAARDLIRRGEARDEESIRIGMSGNLCRCTGYTGIVRAIAKVAKAHSEKAEPDATTRTLGPAPGPDAPDGFVQKVTESPRRAKPDKAKAPAAAPTLTRQASANVQTGEMTQEGKFTKLTQTITVNYPREDVWRYMADIEKVATCMPGVVLDGPPQEGHIDGRMLVKLGPISADLAGEADVTRFEDEWRGVIEGKGRDTRSASLASGRVEYQLTEVDDGAATQMAVSIAYSLAGPLAQFSRGAIVRDLVSRLACAFAQNLEARLSGRESDTAPAALDAGSLVFSVIWGRITALFGKLFGRKSD